mmetsp:Transcript_1781/g.3926  ORF Transcript_1781/g.3926 Transcript_1781/m.3926 type:complete len:220 (+) Transcript_1781:178-837(+)
MVLVTEAPFQNAAPLFTPLASVGFAALTASSTALQLSLSFPYPIETFPIGVNIPPSLLTRMMTSPLMASSTAFPTSAVTPPSFGFGMRPRGPSTRPRAPTPRMSPGVVMTRSTPLMRERSPDVRAFTASATVPSGTDAPKATATSRDAASSLRTRMLTRLPVPWGRDIFSLMFWLGLRGSSVTWRCRLTVSSNFAKGGDEHTPDRAVTMGKVVEPVFIV